MNVINVEKLTKLYKNGRGIKNISFSVSSGEIVGLLGPNGSGKTTTMKAILGLTPADSGKIEIFGMPLADNFENIMRRTGALIEAPAIFTEMTAYKNMELAARYYGKPDKSRIDSVLDAVHLSEYKNDKAGRFSLGMKQRLGLAMALLPKPDLLILDEPTNGLDIEGIIEIRNIIKMLAEKYETTFLIASHLSSEIEKTCSSVAIMHEGGLIDMLPISEALKLNPSLEDYYIRKISDIRRDIEI